MHRTRSRPGGASDGGEGKESNLPSRARRDNAVLKTGEATGPLPSPDQKFRTLRLFPCPPQPLKSLDCPRFVRVLPPRMFSGVVRGSAPPSSRERDDDRRRARRIRQKGGESLARRGEVALVDNVAAGEHAAGLPATDPLDHILGHPGPSVIPRAADRAARWCGAAATVLPAFTSAKSCIAERPCPDRVSELADRHVEVGEQLRHLFQVVLQGSREAVRAPGWTAPC